MFKQVEQWPDGQWRIRKLTLAGWTYWEAANNHWWYLFTEKATAFPSEDDARNAWLKFKNSRRWL